MTTLRRFGKLTFLAALVMVWLLLGACTNLYKQTEQGERRAMTRSEIKQYAEDVFRRHNRVETRLLTALSLMDVDGGAGYDQLLSAETRMLEACEALNELAIRHRDEKRMGFFRKLRLPGTIAACERETENVERLLDGPLGNS